MERTTIGEVIKNKAETVEVALDEYRGKRNIDARVKFNGKFTQKGLAASLETWEALLPVIQEAVRAMRERMLEEATV